ncbi:MAG: hypothetical protein AAB434_09550 [Planctomycetota bacterium]
MLGISRDDPGIRLLIEEETTRTRGLLGLPLLFVVMVAAWGAPLPFLAFALAAYPGGVADLFIYFCLTSFAAFWYASLIGITRVLAKTSTRTRSLDLDRAQGTSDLTVDPVFGVNPRRVVMRLRDIRRIALEGKHSGPKGTDLYATIEAASPSPHRERFRLHVAEVDAHEDARELLFRMAAIADLPSWRTEHDDGSTFVVAAYRAEPRTPDEEVPESTPFRRSLASSAA